MCRAAATGTRVLGMDIDAAGLIALARMGRPVSPKTCAELAAIVDRSHELGMKFVLKGIMTVEDAIAAERAGCDGIVVSNHAGDHRGPSRHRRAGQGPHGRFDGWRHP